MQIFVLRDGKQLGPFEQEHVRADLKAGKLEESDLAWTDGCPNWIPLGVMLGLSQQSGKPPPPPPPFPPPRPAANIVPVGRQSNLSTEDNPMKIFVFKNGQKTGPFSLDAVQTNVRVGLFVASDLCWYEGLANWSPLSVLPGSASATSGTSSEPPPIAVVPPLVPDEPPPPPPPPFPPVPQPTVRKPSETIGMILVMLPAISAILTWFWIGNMRLIDGPGAKLGGLSALTVLFTAALSAFEASELGFGKDKTRPILERVSPLGWFFSIALIWVIDYPRYLYARSRYGVRNLVGFGLLSMILWLVPLGIVSHSIIAAESDMQQRLDQLDKQLR